MFWNNIVNVLSFCNLEKNTDWQFTCAVVENNVSPYRMGRHIVFSSIVRLSVCLSVMCSCPLCIISLVVFTNYSAQLSSMMNGCAMCMFDQGKVRVIKVKQCMTGFHVCSVSFEPLVGFTNNYAHMSSIMSWCAMRMFDQGRFKVIV